MKESDLGPAITTGPLYGHGDVHIDITDFPFMEAAANNPTDDEELPDGSTADTTIDYADLIRDEVFLGRIPFDTIVEGINAQFNDYIGTQDHTNYVEAFYIQLHTSISEVESDESEEHPTEKLDALNTYLNQFVSMMDNLFEQRLAISIMEFEADSYDQDELEYEITMLYEFFILHARDTLKNVIVKSICSHLNTDDLSDKEYYDVIDDKLRYYSPLIIAIEPMEFLRIAKNEDVYEMFQDGRVCGNFLRKFSPRLYAYPDFENEVKVDITMRQQFKEDVLNIHDDPV